MKNIMRKVSALMVLCMMIFAVTAMVTVPVFAEETDNEVTIAAGETLAENAEESTEETTDDATKVKAIAAAATIAIVAAAGAIGMSVSICKSVEGIARQPEADGKIRTSLMLGLVFVETAIIYALIIAILIIFVL